MEYSHFDKDIKELKVTNPIKDYLIETAKWTKIIAIVGFVAVFFMVIVAGIMGVAGAALSEIPEMNGMPMGGFMAVFYLIIAALYYFPIKYLYDFSTKVKKAIEITDQILFEEAIMKLKSHYKYIGILTLIVVIINLGMILMSFFSVLIASFI